MSVRNCGTRTKYVVEKCRCEECRAANATYMRDLMKRRAVGKFRPGSDRWQWVSVYKTQKHIKWLQSRGMGYRQVADRSGVSRCGIQKIMKRSPAGKIHRDTERMILAVSSDMASPDSRIPAAGTWQLVEEMIAFGMSKQKIARSLGQKGRGLQLSRRSVTKRNAEAVARLHESLMERDMSFRRKILGSAA